MSTDFSDFQQHDRMRASIIDAARELFAKFGYKKTTMEDIAMVLRKGKSSLYYYFKNKEDIFQAVLETEEGMLFSGLEKVVKSEAKPKDKFVQYVNVRMHTILKLDNYIRTLRDEIYGGYEFIERLKSKSEATESEFLLSILKEGLNDGSFAVNNLNMAATSIAIAIRGIEVPLLKASETEKDLQTNLDNIVGILFYGIVKR